MSATISVCGVEYVVVDSTPGLEDGSLVLSLRQCQPVPLAERLTAAFGADISRFVCDAIAETVGDLERAVSGDERDGVWEEGYADGLHDVLLAVGIDPQDVLMGRLS